MQISASCNVNRVHTQLVLLIQRNVILVITTLAAIFKQTALDGVERYDVTEAILTLGRDAQSSTTKMATSRSYEV
jgi:hypothetical protein